MARLSGRRVVVAGAGAIGSMLALRLAQQGAQVLLTDPSPLGANASGVAAGMLAPAFEAALDPLSAGRFDLLREARDLWPAAGAPQMARAGAVWVGDEASNAVLLEKLRAMGARAELLEPAAAESLSPGLKAPAGAVFTPEDWMLEPQATLAALRQALLREGGAARPAAVLGWTGAAARFSDGSAWSADALVLAAGLAAEGLEEPPPELACLAPVKGQIASLAGAPPLEGPVVRGEGIYVAPRASGAVIGATMEAGRRDLTIDTDAMDRLRAGAARLFPGLTSALVSGAAGIRASTPDGLPLVGAGRTPGIWLAMGARRNGWLLAPLIAEIIVGQLAGGEGGRWAPPMAPGRAF